MNFLVLGQKIKKLECFSYKEGVLVGEIFENFI